MVTERPTRRCNYTSKLENGEGPSPGRGEGWDTGVLCSKHEDEKARSIAHDAALREGCQIVSKITELQT